MALENIRKIATDILIIGGGTAGCMAAVFAKRNAPGLDVTILEKAHIKRSGCLAMGLNAVNAHLSAGTPEDYLAYVRDDNYEIVRSDLVLSIGRRLNSMTSELENMGIPLPKNSDGTYVTRSSRSIVMLGEQLKPLLAETVRRHGVTVLNRSPVYRLLHDEARSRICGAVAFNLRTREIIVVTAGAVLICTAGASGIYRPSNPGLARTKTWYCPYNAGSGLAMGLRAGAEITSFEMRFVALRTKDVIAPTGTLVLGTRMPQCNARGDRYIAIREAMLGRKLTTCERLFFTLEEHERGRGPCYVDISSLDRHQYNELVESYLNMAPSIVLDLLKNHHHPRTRVEICGSEPYINGGHGMAGFWIDNGRKTTLDGLYAAGDVAGGAPKKYITGCFAEAEMAVEHIIGQWNRKTHPAPDLELTAQAVDAVRAPLKSDGDITFNDVEDRLQKIMEEYAGGSTQNYETSRDKLMLARMYIERLSQRMHDMVARDAHELMRVHDTRDRMLLAGVLVEHLLARRETRWPCYQTRLDFPIRNDLEYMVFINSRMADDGSVQLFRRSVNPPYSVVPGEKAL